MARPARRAKRLGEQPVHRTLDRKAVKRYVGVAGVVLPAFVPLAYQGAAAVRDRWDRERARRLGVPVERLGEFTGKGATVHARLARLADSLAELGTRRPEQAEFVEGSRNRLADLAGAVRAAETMPAARRREAHRTVAGELDGIERELLRRYQLDR